MKILEILKKEYSELEKGSKLIILEGNEGSGKTYTLNEFCKIVKNDGALCVFLSLSKYPENLNILPDVDIIKIIENSLPEAQRNALKNFYYINKEKNMISLITLISSIYKLIIIFDDAENTPSVILNNILYLGINHRDKKLMIILSYNPYLISKTMNEFMVKINTLPNNYIIKIRIPPMTFEEAKEISQERGYKLPDYVIERINQLSNGNISTFIDITNYLRSRNIIDKDGYFVGNYNDIDTIAVSTLNNYLLSLLSSLSDDDLDLLVSASIVGLNFSKSEIKYLMKIDDEKFDKIVENLINKNIIIKLNDEIYSFSNKLFIDTILNKYTTKLKKRMLSKKLAEFYELKNMNNIRIGLLYLDANENQKALEYLKKAIGDLFSKRNYKELIEIFEKIKNLGNYEDNFVIGYSYYKIGKFDKAIEYLSKDDKVKSKLYICLSYLDLGRIDEAEKILNSIEKSIIDYDLQFLYYIVKSYISEKKFNFKEEENNLMKAKEIAEIDGDIEKLSYVNKQIGIYYYMNGDFEKAEKYFENSLVYYKKINDLDGIARIYNNLAIINQGKDLKKSKEFYEKALGMGYLAGNNYILFVINYNLSIINFWLGNIIEAEKLLSVSNKLSKMMNELDVRHAINALLSDINTIQGRYNTARDNIDEAIEITENYNYMYFNDLYIIKKNTINVIFGHNPSSEELNYYSERIYKQTISPLIALFHGEMGISYFFLGDIQLSIKFLESSVQRARKMFQPFDYVFYEGIYLASLFLYDQEKFKYEYDEISKRWKSFNANNIFLRIFDELEDSGNLEKEYGYMNLFLPLYIYYILKYYKTKNIEFIEKAKDLSEKFKFNDILIKKLEKI